MKLSIFTTAITVNLAGITAALALDQSLPSDAARQQSSRKRAARSTFVYPVLSKWAEADRADRWVAVSYQSIASGAGLKQIKSKRSILAPLTRRCRWTNSVTSAAAAAGRAQAVRLS